MIRHAKRLALGDSPDANVVPLASHWNDTHASSDFLILNVTTPNLFEDPSISPTFVEITGATMAVPIGWTFARTFYDFTHIDQVRLEVYCGLDQSTLAGEFRAQYSLDQGISWDYFDGISGPRLSVSFADTISGPGLLRSDWFDIGEAAKTDALVRIGSMLSDGQGIYGGSIALWGR
jgi:hypothetical protein